jgi:hypothetical protein
MHCIWRHVTASKLWLCGFSTAHPNVHVQQKRVQSAVGEYHSHKAAPQPAHCRWTTAHVCLQFSAIGIAARCPDASSAGTVGTPRGGSQNPLRNQPYAAAPPVSCCRWRAAQRSTLSGRHNGTLHGPWQQARQENGWLVVDSANGAC